MKTTIEYDGIATPYRDSSGSCPSCDGPITEGEWTKYGVCTCCALGDADAA